jgi:hypothetical protein
MRKWLFCFQKSVAIVMTHILERRKKEEETNEDQKIWLSELGNGHGHYNSRLGTSIPQPSVNRAYTMEDVPSNNDRSVFNLSGYSSKGSSRLNLTDNGNNSDSPLNSGRLLAISPAIPIVMPTSFKNHNITTNNNESENERNDDSFSRDRVASSYRNDEYSPLTEVMRQHPQHNHHGGIYDDDDEDDDVLRSREDSLADDMMFDMDEHIEEKNLRQPSISKQHSRSSSSNHPSAGVGELLRMSQSNPTSRNATPRNSFTFQGQTLLSSAASSLGNNGIRQPSLQWECGFCSKLGPREKNEDRYVVLPTLSFSKGASSSSSVASGNRSTVPSSSSVSHQQPPPSGLSKSLLSTSLEASAAKGSLLASSGIAFDSNDMNYGYFAVYDGHCGDLAANYLQEHLHDRITRHNSFPNELELAIFDTFVNIDKEFVVCSFLSCLLFVLDVDVFFSFS